MVEEEEDDDHRRRVKIWREIQIRERGQGTTLYYYILVLS